MVLNHVIPCIRRKGPVDNYHTGLGEALHPQLKKDFRRSSRQTDVYEKQVCIGKLRIAMCCDIISKLQLLRMAQERTIVQKIRLKIDNGEQNLAIGGDVSESDENESLAISTLRVRLASRQKQVHVEQYLLYLTGLVSEMQSDQLEQYFRNFIRDIVNNGHLADAISLRYTKARIFFSFLYRC